MSILSEKRRQGLKKKYFIAASAGIYGNIQLVRDNNARFQSVSGGNSNTITIGEGSNIRDDTIIHVDENVLTTVGKYVTVGYQHVLYGCEVDDDALIGVGSTTLNNAVTGENSLIGAGFSVTEGKVIPSNVLAFGRPAKVTRPLTATEIINNHTNALYYVQRAEEFRQQEYPKLAQNWKENDEES